MYTDTDVWLPDIASLFPQAADVSHTCPKLTDTDTQEWLRSAEPCTE